ncbi:MAG: DUF2807 domain-containing protein [Bacteroidales bacterium]|nr:MAG: DUF2807 domain-containing protein [Bacteroidales bacterium]
MKTSIITLAVFTAVTLFVSCEKDDLNFDPDKTVHGTGDVVTKRMTLDSFNEVHLKGVSNVYITLSNEQSTVLKAQQNIMDVMTWEVVANRLVIGLKENTSISNTEEIRFEIEIPELTRVIHEGVGDFSLAGDYLMSLDIEYDGVGNIYSYDLPVYECSIISSGVGDCKLKIFDYLDVYLSGTGSVYYKGNPEIDSAVIGIGKLINDN